jgi:hypothetical protein
MRAACLLTTGRFRWGIFVHLDPLTVPPTRYARPNHPQPLYCRNFHSLTRVQGRWSSPAARHRYHTKEQVTQMNTAQIQARKA